MQTSLFQTLGIIDCAIFKHREDGRFERVHGQQAWLVDFMSSALTSAPLKMPDDSAFLQDFLVDAQAFWRQGNNGQIHSGIWSEQTATQLLRLEAIAATHDGEQFLVISNIQHAFERQQKTLQSARELLLSNDQIVAQHSYIQERLESAINTNHDLHAQQRSMQHAIEHAECAVMMMDGNLQPVQDNALARGLFDTAQNGQKHPAEMLLAMIEKQYPEYQRVIHTASRWDGEIYWHKPPYTHKWLKVALVPLKDASDTTRQWLLSASDITRIKFLLQANERLALQDNITGLSNRQAFWQILEQEIETGKPFFVVAVDIKRFKAVNELHGHGVGDQVLTAFAERLKGVKSSSDHLARVGGDVFAVVLHDTHSQTQCSAFVRRMFDALKQPITLPDGKSCNVEVSAGAVSYPADASTSDDLMRFIDLAVYTAKKQQKTHLQFYSENLKELSRQRLLLEQALREAIELQQFELFLQPMLDLNSGELVRAEALLRWRDHNGQLIEPDAFIGVAEQTGLIVPIGKWVITRACEILQVLQRRHASMVLSINLSPRQVADRRLFDYLKGCIEASGVDPTRLELELTEGVLVDDFDQVERLLTQVRELGIGVAIDDFGTGYSSLAYLQRLPIDHVKIDRSFVRDLDSNENDKAIVLAVIAMAHNLNLGVIAEGVETDQQRDFLARHQCECAQGYLFGKPMPLEQFCQSFLTD